MSDKMREEFEKWALTECFDLTAVGGFYSDNETDAAYLAWQAAQSVPVVAGGQPHRLKETELRVGNSSVGWIGCHTDDGKVFIAAAELTTLREKAAMADELRKLLEEARDDVNSILNDILVLGNYPHNQRRLQIQQELLAAIDAAIAQGKGE